MLLSFLPFNFFEMEVATFYKSTSGKRDRGNVHNSGLLVYSPQLQSSPAAPSRRTSSHFSKTLYLTSISRMNFDVK